MEVTLTLRSAAEMKSGWNFLDLRQVCVGCGCSQLWRVASTFQSFLQPPNSVSRTRTMPQFWFWSQPAESRLPEPLLSSGSGLTKLHDLVINWLQHL